MLPLAVASIANEESERLPLSAWNHTCSAVWVALLPSRMRLDRETLACYRSGASLCGALSKWELV